MKRPAKAYVFVVPVTIFAIWGWVSIANFIAQLLPFRIGELVGSVEIVLGGLWIAVVCSRALEELDWS